MFSSVDFFTKKLILELFLKQNPEFLNNSNQVLENILHQCLIFNDWALINNKELLITKLNNIADLYMNHNKPISKIFNIKTFYNLDFYVDEHVLCPRPETEMLIDLVLNRIFSNNFNPKTVLDLGTGSGALAIVLQKYLPEAQITAIDICTQAINIAKKNAKMNLETESISFICNDWLNGIENPYDLLISNPPYLIKQEIYQMKELQYDPYLALYGGKSGFDRYKDIAEKKSLFKWIILEINPKHTAELQKLFDQCEIFQDLHGNNRVLIWKNTMNNK